MVSSVKKSSLLPNEYLLSNPHNVLVMTWKIRIHVILFDFHDTSSMAISNERAQQRLAIDVATFSSKLKTNPPTTCFLPTSYPNSYYYCYYYMWICFYRLFLFADRQPRLYRVGGRHAWLARQNAWLARRISGLQRRQRRRRHTGEFPQRFFPFRDWKILAWSSQPALPDFATRLFMRRTFRMKKITLASNPFLHYSAREGSSTCWTSSVIPKHFRVYRVRIYIKRQNLTTLFTPLLPVLYGLWSPDV